MSGSGISSPSSSASSSSTTTPSPSSPVLPKPAASISSNGKSAEEEDTVDSCYEFHSACEELDERNHLSEKSSPLPQAQGFKQLFARRRSISLTSETDEVFPLGSGPSASSLYYSRSPKLARISTHDVASGVRLRSGARLDADSVVAANRFSWNSNSSSGSLNQGSSSRKNGPDSGGSDVIAFRTTAGQDQDFNDKSLKRPSSILINENDDLLKLGDELYLRDLERELDENESGGEQEDARSSSEKAKAAPTPCATGGTTLVRRNSSGYSSGSCSSNLAAAGNTSSPRKIHPKVKDAPAVSKVPAPVAQLKSGTSGVSRRSSLLGSSTSTTGGRVVSPFNDPTQRRSSICVPRPGLSQIKHQTLPQTGTQSTAAAAAALGKEQGNKPSKLTFGSIFGSNSKRSSLNAGLSGDKSSPGTPTATSTSSPSPGRFAKRFDRQLSISEGNSKKEEKQKKKSLESSSSPSEKRAAFTKNRSSTGLSLFSSRRRSIAITDDVYDAIRGARSQLDLSELDLPSHEVSHSPMVQKKSSSKMETVCEKESQRSATTTTSLKPKVSFKDRSWTEIEKLWRGKIKEPPSIEGMLKPNSSFRNKSRTARSKTIPLGETSSSNRSSWAPSSGVSGVNSVSNTPPRSASPSGAGSAASPRYPLSPGCMRKAIDHLAPHVLEEWQNGAPTPSYQRNQSVAFGFPRPQSKGQDSIEEHFDQLVKSW